MANKAIPLQASRERWNDLLRAAGFALWVFPMAQFWIRFLPPLRPYDFHVSAPPWWFWAVAVACCAVPYTLPLRWFQPAWFEDRAFFERLGVHLFRRFVPDGDLVNRRLRTLAPGYSLIRTRSDLRAHIREGLAGERAHLAFFLAGLLTTLFALRLGETGSAVALLLGNMVFNFYPVLLQRYKRARLTRTAVRCG